MIVLIFSKNRAMQLQATIESFYLHCCEDKMDNPNVEICVLYKATSPLHQKQYKQLRENFSNINFQEEYNFKSQILEIMSKFRYVLFVCDDIVFIKSFSLSEIMVSMKKNENVLSFTLLLGRNTHYCYAKSCEQRIPEFEEREGILKFDWTKAEYDFGYPMHIGACVFFIEDILWLIKQIDCCNPNLLEGCMAPNAEVFRIVEGKRLCYEKSVGVCIPANLVQDVTKNRVGCNSKYSSKNLAKTFDLGWRIDVESYSGFLSDGSIQEVELRLK